MCFRSPSQGEGHRKGVHAKDRFQRPRAVHPSSLNSDSCCHTSTLENTRYLGILPDTYSASIYGLVYPDGERISSSDIRKEGSESLEGDVPADFLLGRTLLA